LALALEFGEVFAAHPPTAAAVAPARQPQSDEPLIGYPAIDLLGSHAKSRGNLGNPVRAV
jgi:hypothetical protein